MKEKAEVILADAGKYFVRFWITENFKGTKALTRENPDKMSYNKISLAKNTTERVESVGWEGNHRQHVTFPKPKDFCSTGTGKGFSIIMVEDSSDCQL